VLAGVDTADGDDRQDDSLEDPARDEDGAGKVGPAEDQQEV